MAFTSLLVQLALAAPGGLPAVAPPQPEKHPILKGKGEAELHHGAPTSPEASLTILTLQPGAEVPEHVHEKSVEMLYVLEGEAEMTHGGKTVRLGPGSSYRIPMNSRHAAKVISKVPLKAVQVYSPAGPEQRFRPQPDAKKK